MHTFNPLNGYFNEDIMGPDSKSYLNFLCIPEVETIFIQDFQVSNKNLGTGLAQELFNQLLEIAERRKIRYIKSVFIPKIDLEERTHRFYLRNGFTIEDDRFMYLDLSPES